MSAMRGLQYLRALGDYLLLPRSELFVERQQEIEETLWEVLVGVQIRRREIHGLRHGLSVCDACHFFVSLRHRDIMAGREYGVKYLERRRRYRAPALAYRDKEVRA